MPPSSPLRYGCHQRRRAVVRGAAWSRYLKPERIERARAGGDEHALRLQVEIERLDRELPAEAGLLVAAERDARKRGVRHVDSDRAGLEPRGEAMPARRVTRPNGGVQAVLGVV